MGLVHKLFFYISYTQMAVGKNDIIVLIYAEIYCNVSILAVIKNGSPYGSCSVERALLYL